MQTAEKLLCIGAKIRSQRYNEMSNDAVVIKNIITANMEINNYENHDGQLIVPIGARLPSNYFIIGILKPTFVNTLNMELKSSGMVCTCLTTDEFMLDSATLTIS
jgi:hypothetical protein